jgi:ribosomal protein S18 acetylase RimI-like enzyme
MTDLKQERLKSASNPRRATLDDVIPLSRLFTSTFMDDPVFDYMVRPGEKRRAALQTFFIGMFTARDIPQNEVWMSNDGNACVSWLPSDARRGASGIRILKWLPWSYRVFGFERFGRALAMQEAMERNHPKEPHFYLAFIAVSPEFQGAGLGSRILKATLEKIGALGTSAYVENSRERNTPFYQRAGFVAQSNISPEGAPPLLAMWRKPHISVG